MHDTTLISTIVFSMVLAFVGGFIASKLRVSSIVGYLLVGVLLGPRTPGLMANPELASQLSEIGVILLMFGVGLHFSFQDLLAVRKIAIPGALLQIGVATLLGAAISLTWGWSLSSSIVLGLALSVASTVVLLKALEAQGTLSSVNGNIAVGWLIVEDLAVVFLLVLLPAFAGFAKQSPNGLVHNELLYPALVSLGITLGKVIFFIAFMLLVGSRVLPWLLNQVTQTGSRELFTLFVVGTALGIAYGSSSLFGVSFALGAFFAGLIITESNLSHRVAEEALPLRDAFAVLFFVSVGMLFEPKVLIEHPFRVLTLLAIIVLGKSIAAFFLIRAFRYPVHTALTVSASLAQIGEFSFILASLGVQLGLLPRQGQSLILAAALLSISLNPFVFKLINTLTKNLQLPDELGKEKSDPLSRMPIGVDTAEWKGHVVIIGYGRVGGFIGNLLEKAGIRFLVIEQNREYVEWLRQRGITALYGNGETLEMLEEAKLRNAHLLVITLPDPFQARQVLNIAKDIIPASNILVRTHDEQEQAFFQQEGVALSVMGERELALSMANYILKDYGRLPVQ